MARRWGVRVQILVEDEALERFAREALLRFGFSRHELRVTPYPVGQGSARDWVDRQYPVEVRTLRAKAYQKVGLVVGTDADELTVQQRADRLARTLADNRMPPRAGQERIVLWIPKWNIETWLLYFAGHPVDEDHDYSHRLNNPDYCAAAAAFVEEYRQYKRNATTQTQPSLRRS